MTIGDWLRAAWSVLAGQPATTARRKSRSVRDLGRFSSRPASRAACAGTEDDTWVFPGDIPNHEMRVRLHRFLRDRIPVLNAVIWTWTRLCAAPARFVVDPDADATLRAEAEAVLEQLAARIYPQRVVRFGGLEALLEEFYTAFFTDGAVAGELVLNPSGNAVDRFQFIDTASVGFTCSSDGEWKLHQRTDDANIPLDSDAVFYAPLDNDATSPHGRSLLGAVEFVARIEQRLLADLGRAMHNAGYNRLHVRLDPPPQRPGEDDSDYTARVNRYFDDTVTAMRDLRVDDNPVTWNDVAIDYIGPNRGERATTSWYINHKAMIEDIIAGTHLSPFMLGYSYGDTYNRAQFKLDLILRQARLLQLTGARFCEWIAAVELALHGLDVDVRCEFDNRMIFGQKEKIDALRAVTDVVITQLDNDLIDTETARQRIAERWDV